MRMMSYNLFNKHSNQKRKRSFVENSEKAPNELRKASLQVCHHSDLAQKTRLMNLPTRTTPMPQNLRERRLNAQEQPNKYRKSKTRKNMIYMLVTTLVGNYH
jgi:hypothetical protein